MPALAANGCFARASGGGNIHEESKDQFMMPSVPMPCVWERVERRASVCTLVEPSVPRQTLFGFDGFRCQGDPHGNIWILGW